MIRLTALIGLVLGTALPAPCQTAQEPNSVARSHGPLVLELPVSTRGLALGGAFAAFDDDSDAVFLNPALITDDGGFGLTLQRYGSGASLGSASASRGWFGGAVGIGVQFLEFGSESSSPTALLRDEGSLTLGGPVGWSEWVLTVGYSRRMLGLEWGAGAKVLAQRAGGNRGSTMALDLGAAHRFGPIKLSVSAQNLGPALTVAGETVPLAKRITLGAASRRRPLGPLDVALAGAVVRDGSGDFLPGGGVEIAWWPVVGRTFVARLGVHRVVDTSASPLTFGGGFYGDVLALEYAYQAYDGSLAGAHRVTLAFR